MIAVPGRVNGGLHEMLIVEELMKDENKSPTEDKGPWNEHNNKRKDSKH